MAAAAVPQAGNFGVDDAKKALTEILDAFDVPENAARMEEARDNAGNDMLKAMQVVFPVATQIQMAVIQKYGFPGNGDGIIHFAQAIRLYEKQDSDVAQLNSKLRSVIMPQMAAPDPAPQAAAT